VVTKATSQVRLKWGLDNLEPLYLTLNKALQKNIKQQSYKICRPIFNITFKMAATSPRVLPDVTKNQWPSQKYMPSHHPMHKAWMANLTAFGAAFKNICQALSACTHPRSSDGKADKASLRSDLHCENQTAKPFEKY
jgi:hypothetical protein